jgi:hypothetical protein
VSAMQALQATLAGEHAAVYLYGVVGGRLPDSTHPALADLVAAAYTTHRARRDRLEAVIHAGGATPVASAVSYETPTPCRTVPQLTEAAATVERRCAGLYAALVAATVGSQRGWAVDALTDSAVRALGFGATPTAFPGLSGSTA